MNKTSAERDKQKKREKSVLVIFHAPCVCFFLFSYSFIETAVLSNKCLQ